MVGVGAYSFHPTLTSENEVITIWVQLLCLKQLDIDGSRRAYHPGDWVDLGKQTALRMIQNGEARAIEPVKLDIARDCGIVLTREEPLVMRNIRQVAADASVSVGAPSLAYERTLVLDPKAPLRMDLLGVGFGLLERWQVAAPLWSYDELAADVGEKEDRQRTEALLHDLRVPLYDTRIVYLRRCPETAEVLRLWREDSGDDRHRFLRAIYQVKPLVLALPATWRRE